MLVAPHRFGAQPSDPTKPRLALAPHLQADTFPNRCDWLGEVQRWPMYANDELGDCEVAMAGHIIGAASQYGGGKAQTLPRRTIVDTYSALSGYDPKTGANDNGVATQDLLNYWRKTGIGGHKILAFASLPLPSENRAAFAFMKSALHVFGSLCWVVDIHEQTERRWSSGKPWGRVDPSSTYVGLHAIHGGTYNASGGWKAVTWGGVQAIRQPFLTQNLRECWVVITPEWFSNAGKSPTGLDLRGLGENLARLTGDPNPFA